MQDKDLDTSLNDSLEEQVVLDDLPENIKQEIESNPHLKHQLFVAFSRKETTYQSNFPHPEHLEAYCRMYPDAAKIIFEEYQKVGESRREQEIVGLNGAINFDKRAQYLGFLLPICLILGGIYSMHQGWDKTALAILALGAAPIIRSFFNPRGSKGEK